MNEKHQDYLRTLRRRRDWLRTRITRDDARMRGKHLDVKEYDALEWVLSLLDKQGGDNGR